MRTRYWSMSVVLGGLIVAGTAWAALDCGPVPSCEELGFTNTADECGDSGMLKCPFDETAVFCREKFEPKECEVGDVLYSDLKCYDEVPSGLTAIAVVYDTEQRLALNLYEDGYIVWGNSSSVIPGLEICSRYGFTDCPSSSTDGKANTKKIVDFYGSGTDYAAGYCYNYTTKGTQKGDWFLPSVRQIESLVESRELINKKLDGLRTSYSNIVTIALGDYWTSTPGTYNEVYQAWIYAIRSTEYSWTREDVSYPLLTRCVINY